MTCAVQSGRASVGGANGSEDAGSVRSARKPASRLEAFRWDHVALSRRLAAIEDHVEMLLRQQPSSDESMDQTDLPAVVPMAQRPMRTAPLGGRTLRRRAQA